MRAGDQDASTELAGCSSRSSFASSGSRCGSGATSSKIRSRLGSSDVCQSVFKSLFAGLKEGPVRAESTRTSSERLLRVMSRFKIATEGRRLSVILREVIDGGSPPDQADSGPSPEKPVDDQDLAETVVKHFSEDELELLQRRLDGETWPAIAAQLGVSADTLRKKLERAIERVNNVPSLHGDLP